MRQLVSLAFVVTIPFCFGDTRLSAQETSKPNTDSAQAESSKGDVKNANPKADVGKPEDKKPEDKKPEDKKPEDKKPEDKKPEDKKPEDKKPEDKKPEDKKPEDKKPEDKKPEDKLPPIRKLPGVGSLTHPKLPGQPWRIHDLFRPHPPVVEPGADNRSAPSDATVLFDGNDLSHWCHRGGKEDELYEPRWKVTDGYFEVTSNTGSLYTLESFGSCQLHIEWASPAEVRGDSQGRGNSGIKLMERFEIQVLDSYNNRTYADGQAGSVYGQYPPLVNASRRPGEWQTYDIFFEAPVFEENKLIRPAYVTVIHNGVLVQHHREFAGPTGLRNPGYAPQPPAAPIMLQDHGNPVRYRNIWIRTSNLQ